MKKISFISILLCHILICEISAQPLLKSEFSRTRWFSLNENDSFYKSDTIKLIRFSRFNSYLDSINEEYIKLQYVGHKDITDLSFNKYGRLSIINLDVNRWTNSKRVGTWRWKFNECDQILSLYFNNKVDASFKIISRTHDTITWEFKDKDKTTEFRLNLIILQLVRLKK